MYLKLLTNVLIFWKGYEEIGIYVHPVINFILTVTAVFVTVASNDVSHISSENLRIMYRMCYNIFCILVNCILNGTNEPRGYADDVYLLCENINT
jgi:hypothetical protein